MTDSLVQNLTNWMGGAIPAELIVFGCFTTATDLFLMIFCGSVKEKRLPAPYSLST